MRRIGLLSLLFAMTVLGSGAAAADPGTVTLTNARTWIQYLPGTDKYRCEFEIDNPNEDSIQVLIEWDEPGPVSAGVYDDPTIRSESSSLVNLQVSSITIQAKNRTTANKEPEFEVEVPMPGSWP